MDAYEQCEIGGLAGITGSMLAEREKIVFGWCSDQGIPVGFGIGGGYTNAGFSREALVDLHRQTLTAAAGMGNG